jgi:hypothetical protein
MKILLFKFYFSLLTLLVVINSEPTQFTNILFKKDHIGVPHHVNFLNEDEAIVSTNKGIVTKLNLKSGKVVWKRLYKKLTDLCSDDNCKKNIFLTF